MVHGPPHVLGARIREGGSEARRQPRPEVLPEGARPPEVVLHEASLRLVKAERRRLADRRPEALAGQVLFVEPVADLVERGEQAGREGARPETGGEAHVARADADRRWMDGLVEPATREVEAEPPGKLARHLGLNLHVHAAREEFRQRPALADR